MSTTTDWWGRRLLAQQQRQQRQAERSAGWLPGWRTRRRRRALVVVFGIGVLLLLTGVVLVAPGLEERTRAVAFAATWLPGSALTLGGWLVLRVLTSGVAEYSPGILDELEASRRNAARAVGLQVTLYAALVPLAVLLLGSSAGQPSASAYPGGLLLAVAILLGGCAPTLLLAWTDPEDDPATEPSG